MQHAKRNRRSDRARRRERQSRHCGRRCRRCGRERPRGTRRHRRAAIATTTQSLSSRQQRPEQHDKEEQNRRTKYETENSRRVMTAARHKHPAAVQSARPPPPQLRRARQSQRIGRRGARQARRSSVSPRPERNASQSEIRGSQRTTASRETASSRVNSRPRKRKRDHHTAESIGHACESHQRLAQLLGRLQHRLQLRPPPFPNVRLHRRGRCEAIARRVRKHLAEKPTQTRQSRTELDTSHLTFSPRFEVSPWKELDLVWWLACAGSARHCSSPPLASRPTATTSSITSWRHRKQTLVLVATTTELDTNQTPKVIS